MLLELTEQAGPDRLECAQCEQDRAVKDLGPLVLPAPTKRELVAALVSTSDDPGWEDRVLHAKLLPERGRGCDLLVLVGVEWPIRPGCLDLWLDLLGCGSGVGVGRGLVTLCGGG